MAHDVFKALALEDIKKLFRPGLEDQKVLIDVKGLYPPAGAAKHRSALVETVKKGSL